MLYWQSADREQAHWPVPRVSLLVAFFVMGLASPVLGGRLGIVAVFFAAACFPSKALRAHLRKGDLISIIAIVSCVMILGNFDAIGDLLGNDSFRFSWILLGLSGLAVPARFKLIRGPVFGCCMAMIAMMVFQITSAVGNTSVISAIERNGSYLAAFLLATIVLIRKASRDTFIWQMALVSMVNCGFCAFEILYPTSSITISSSRLADTTLRSAGLYANAITSGLMVTNFLLITAMSCTKPKATKKEKAALLCMTGITGIGVLATFSRSAALAFFMAGIMVALRIANNKVDRFIQYAPVAVAVLLVSFFAAGEFMVSKGSLHKDATKRYDMMKNVMQGDVGLLVEALIHRTGAWEPSRRYWEKPTVFGYGYAFCSENEIFPPHNMIILTLVETGLVGLLVFVSLIVYFCGFGAWSFTARNGLLFSALFLPILLIIVESHSLFTRRYFCVYLVNLMLLTRVIFSNKELRR